MGHGRLPGAEAFGCAAVVIDGPGITQIAQAQALAAVGTPRVPPW